MIRFYSLFTATLVAAAIAAGCASSSKPAPAGSDAPPPAKEARAEKPAKGVTAPPANSPLAKITRGMPDSEVRRILGEPDDVRQYETGKRWIPGYGAANMDNRRTEYVYRKLGRVTLTHNEWSGSQKVLRVDYDPNL